MADSLLPIQLPPGVSRNGTRLESRGRWYDASLVRFFSGAVGPVGGWRMMQDDSGSDLASLTGVPRGAHAWRGAGGERFIAFGTTEKLYLLTAGTLYDITPVGFTAAASEDSELAGTGGAYGGGPYGVGAYGVGAATASLVETSSWSLDNFGDYLVATSTSDHKLYVWEGNVANPAIEVSGTDFPTHVEGCVVTPEGFLVALGYSAGAANVRGVTWASQRTYTTWEALITNSAGDFDLASSGRLLAGLRTKSETLLWTDADLHVMTYRGGPLVYRFDQAGEKCGVISPRAAVTVDTKAMWMGRNNFFVYDGSVRAIPCDVFDYVFGNFNEAQAVKVWAQTIAEFGEVWWFYPGADSNEIDHYVVYNYLENHWSVGRLRRTAGVDAGALSKPVLVSPEGEVYEHEIGTERIDVIGTTPFVESGPIQLGDGDRLITMDRVIPDEQTSGDAELSLYVSNVPTGDEFFFGGYSLDEPTPIRVKGRAIRITVSSLENDSDWRLGVLRFGVKPSSRR